MGDEESHKPGRSVPGIVPLGGTKPGPSMFYVYLLRSVRWPTRTYIGFSTDLRNRFADHNAGRSRHTTKWKPWHLVAYMAFQTESRAREFERYLKSHSGQAFASKRLW